MAAHHHNHRNHVVSGLAVGALLAVCGCGCSSSTEAEIIEPPVVEEVVEPTTPAPAPTASTVANTGKVFISGELAVGQTLTATPSGFNPAPSSYTYKWYRGDTEVGQGGTYKVTAKDAGQYIRVECTASAGHTAIAAVQIAPAATTTPTPSPTQTPDASNPTVIPPVDATNPSVTPPTQTPDATLPTVTPPTQTPDATLPTVTPPTQTPDATQPTVTPPTLGPDATLPTVTPPTQTPDVTLPTVTPPTQTPDASNPTVTNEPVPDVVTPMPMPTADVLMPEAITPMPMPTVDVLIPGDITPNPLPTVDVVDPQQPDNGLLQVAAIRGGDVVITRQGNTLIATAQDFSPEPTTITYQWFVTERGSTQMQPIVGPATNELSINNGSWAGALFTVQATAIRADYAPAAVMAEFQN